MRDFSPSLDKVKVPILPRVGPPNREVQDQHEQRRYREPEQTFPPNDLERLKRVLLQDILLQHELTRREDLRAGNQEYSHNRLDSFRCPRRSRYNHSGLLQRNHGR